MAGEWINWQQFQGVNQPEIEREKKVRGQENADQLAALNTGITKYEDAGIQQKAGGGMGAFGPNGLEQAKSAAEAHAKKLKHDSVASGGWDPTASDGEWSAGWEKLQGRITTGADDVINKAVSNQSALDAKYKSDLARMQTADAERHAVGQAADQQSTDYNNKVFDQNTAWVDVAPTEKQKLNLDQQSAKDSQTINFVASNGGVPAGWDHEKRMRLIEMARGAHLDKRALLGLFGRAPLTKDEMGYINARWGDGAYLPS